MAHISSDSLSSNGRLLDPSELGTKEYWDNVYSRELLNHAEDEDDEGTVWFSESNAEEAVLKKLAELHESALLQRCHVAESKSPPSRFLDLGTGNGHMIFELGEADDEGQRWNGGMVGVDYSEGSIQLARRIAEQKHHDDQLDASQLRFDCWDLLHDQPGDWLAGGFDVVLDKGTFDAISLMDHSGVSDHPCQVYREKVTPLIKSGGFLFVTSCNWTKQELLQWLAPSEGDLLYYDEAKYPTFTFGGQTGQTIVTIIFRKKNR